MLRHNSLYLLYLVRLQEVTGLFEVGLECVRLQLRLDGRSMFGVHLLLSGDLQGQIHVRYALHGEWFNLTLQEAQMLSYI